ncbi:MAG: hypothetical protein JWM11_6272 [Planctomycetaceae bacterium]|nr:hypothetical protein [Planctomycetaceae bacterium]
MSAMNPSYDNDHLKRLHPAFYRGQACVHWNMTIEDRRTGWLVPIFYYKFRELLTHTMFRYGISCPIFCLMPDHMHLLWLGIADNSDQRLAIKFLRQQLYPVLSKFHVRLQRQPYDRVLRDDERQRIGLQNIVEYIARNPERKQLVPLEGYRDYDYTGCLIPGYPDTSPFQPGYWSLFDRLISKLRHQGLVQSEWVDDAS